MNPFFFLLFFFCLVRWLGTLQNMHYKNESWALKKWNILNCIIKFRRWKIQEKKCLKSGRNLNKKFIEQLYLSGTLHFCMYVSCHVYMQEYSLHTIDFIRSSFFLYLKCYISCTIFYRVFNFLYTVTLKINEWMKEFHIKICTYDEDAAYVKCVGQEWGEFQTCMKNLIESVLLFYVFFLQ